MRFLKDNALVIGISTLTILFLIVILRDIVPIFLLAVSVAIVAYPMSKRIDYRFNNKTMSAFVTTAIVFLIVSIIIVAPLYIVYQNNDYIVESIDDVQRKLENSTMPMNISSADINAGDEIAAFAVSLARNVPIYTVNAILFFIFLFMMLSKSEEIKGKSQDILKYYPKADALIEKLYDRSYSVLYMVYVANLATALASAVLAIPLFMLLGYEQVFLLAIVIGIFELLPIVGPSIIVFTIAIHQLILENIIGAGFALVYGIVIVASLPDYLIRPMIIGKGAKINEALVLVSILGGLLTIGIWGAIFGPWITILAKTVFEFLTHERKEMRFWRRSP